MTHRVKIYGAGSIGNHLAHASRALGWAVDICDVDEAALERTRQQIYPGRYGQWDEAIGLFTPDTVPQGDYDFIFIGTPPDSHMTLALLAVAEQPKAILVEKPLCNPDMVGAQELFDRAKAANVAAFVGYDHAVGKSSQKFAELIREQKYGDVETLDVEFREHWGGIFAAHPWLSGPSDSYLGYWQRGGGACGEHSHAINLWQSFAHELEAGRVTEVSAEMEYVRDQGCDYDKLCLMNLRTESGLLGRVVQDVVTRPTRKWARLQGKDGYLEWSCGAKPGCDTVAFAPEGGEVMEDVFTKTRPDDFIQELSHINSMLKCDPATSPISLMRGLETMLVVAAAHKSAQEQRTIRIDYNKGYTREALS